MTDDLRERLQSTLGASYTIEQELGGGGMSRVFVATERALNRRVVVKVLPGEMSGQLAIDRFRREISVAAQLQHPHIVPLLTAGETGGVPYFTMPFITGESLRARLAGGGAVPLTETVRILREVASALAFAHEAGVVHRDIKPDNVLISSGSAMVTDFGVAKALSASTTAGDGGLTSVGVALGTPAYMAPEQAAADPLADHRTDIYAWGILAYELLTGATPFAGRPAAAMLAAHVVEPVTPMTNRFATIPPALAALVMRCLAKNPGERPQRADDIVHALDSVSTPSSGTLANAPALPAPKRAPSLRLAWVATILLVVAGAAWYFSNHHGGAPIGGPKSVAVLPFENAGGDSTPEYFADGMTDDIASALINQGVRVAARTSSYTYKGKHPTPQEVGTTLGVDAVLQSKVSRLGNRMRVSAELVNARDAIPIWSYSVDRDASDIFAVQHAITDSIVGVLRIKLANAPARPAVARNEDPVLHELVTRARYFANLATPEGVQQGVALFRQVIARDSLNTDARLGLAFALAELADGAVPPTDVFPEAFAQISRVLAIDSLNAAAWALKAGLSAQYTTDPVRTRGEIDRAMALNPNDFLAQIADAFYWMSHGDAERTVAAARETVRLDPLSAISGMVLEWAYYVNGQNDSVIVRATRLDSLYPGLAYIDDFRAYALAGLKRYDDAERAFRTAENILGHRSPGLAWVLASRG